MIQAGFGFAAEHPDFAAMREEFLSYYGAHSCERTTLFAGIPELLEAIEAKALPWGIVTNKPERFTLPIVAALGFQGRCACVVGGDTTANAKPHPAPLLEAARRIHLPPESCWYVGDDLRDVQAARAAGMRSVAVEYGYLGTENGSARHWNADLVIAFPLELLPHL